MITGRTIVMFATVPWHWNWQRQHEWASRLAEHNQVIYISNIGVNNHLPINILKKVLKHRGPAEYEHVLSDNARKNLTFLTPLYAPWHGIGWLNRINAAMIARKLRPLIKHEHLLLWICTPSDTVTAILKYFPTATTLYDIAMRFAKRRDVPARVAGDQNILAQKVDSIIYDAKASLDDLPHAVRSKAHYIPQGVNESLLTKQPRTSDPLQGLGHPRLGYVGTLHSSVDAELLRHTIDAMPNAHLVMIGSYKKIPTVLQHPRISFTGPVNFTKLPAYLEHLDIGLIPYRVNEFTAGVFPTKMFEYVAAGLPTVSTFLPELKQFSAHIALTSGKNEFVEAIQSALDQGRTTPNKDFLQKNSWSARFAEVTKIIEAKTVMRS